MPRLDVPGIGAGDIGRHIRGWRQQEGWAGSLGGAGFPYARRADAGAGECRMVSADNCFCGHPCTGCSAWKFHKKQLSAESHSRENEPYFPKYRKTKKKIRGRTKEWTMGS